MAFVAATIGVTELSLRARVCHYQGHAVDEFHGRFLGSSVVVGGGLPREIPRTHAVHVFVSSGREQKREKLVRELLDRAIDRGLAAFLWPEA